MCRDISFHSNIQLIQDTFPGITDKRIHEAASDVLVHVTCEIFPAYPIVVNRKELTLYEMDWGIIPSYEKDPENRQKRRRSMVNAQSERVVDDNRSYWYRLRQNRCLIPVTGIYEHRKVPGFKNKIPYLVQQKGREGYFVPALYQISEEVDKETGELYKVPTFTMLTRSANELMRWIHNDGENKHRMPLFLTEEMEKAWLREDLSDGEMRELFHYEMPTDQLKSHAVFSIRGQKERPDQLAKDAPWNWENLPEFEQER